MTTSLHYAPTPTTWAPSDRPSIRARLDDLNAIRPTLKSEWVKLSSLRSTFAILGVNMVVAALVSWLTATFATGEVLTVSQIYIYATVLTAVFSAVAGVLTVTSEMQHGTLATALSAQPARWVIVAAKAVVASGTGLALGATGIAAGVGGAAVGGLRFGDTSDMPVTVLWALLFTTMAGILGVGIGLIARHSSGAISGLMVWALGVEMLLRGATPARFARFLPFGAGNALLGVKSTMESAERAAAAFSRPENALLFIAYAAAALVAGTILLYRRDAD